MGRYYQSFEKHWGEDEDFEPDYPEDLELIREYLSWHGDLKCSNRKLDELYRDFSDTWSAVWLGVDINNLQNFAQWLDKQD